VSIDPNTEAPGHDAEVNPKVSLMYCSVCNSIVDDYPTCPECGADPQWGEAHDYERHEQERLE
jgi:hypothetical protein